MQPVVLPSHKIHSSSSARTASSDEWEYMPIVTDAKADEEMLHKLLESYAAGAVLGKGSSGQVFQVTDKVSGETRACKVVRKNSAINDDRTMSTETEIMKRMKHENILRLHELYETSTSRWFILELANAGSLQQALALEDNYSEAVVAGAFKQVLEGVKYLHSMGIVHRDLKQDNILCSVTTSHSGVREYNVKIADFGLSAVRDVKTSNSFQRSPTNLKNFHKLKEMWGTKEYFAPEVFKKAYGPQVDVWSLGCVLYELLVGETPFPIREKPASQVEKYLFNGGKRVKRYFELRSGWQTLSYEARDLISRMLKVNPGKRLSVDECLSYPFITRELFCNRISDSGSSKIVPVTSTWSSREREEVSTSSYTCEDAFEVANRVLTHARQAAHKQVQRNERKLEALQTRLDRTQ